MFIRRRETVIIQYLISSVSKKVALMIKNVPAKKII